MAQIAHYLHTPLSEVEEMLGDEVLAYHASAMRLVQLQNPTRS